MYLTYKTSFIMPALFDSLVKDQGLTPHKAWRVAFVVPFILIMSIALGMLFFCEDTPTGAWADRHNAVQNASASSNTTLSGTIVDASGKISNTPEYEVPEKKSLDEKKKTEDSDPEYATASKDIELIVQSEVIVKPTFKEALRVIFSWQCLMLSAPYACSFGGELAINSILGAYYTKNFPYLGQTNSGRWAAMFGLLNVFFRPAGGIIADILYRKTNSVSVKKWWLIFVGCSQGAMCLAIGILNPKSEATMFGLIAGLAFFMDAANGANFAIVPHVHPFANGEFNIQSLIPRNLVLTVFLPGILSGVVGATGNFGGVIFSVIFRYNGTQYDKVIMIIGAICIGVNMGVSWISPIPKGQIGGR
jgi:NNP family nitrate/nitrite transporter-like MFS transporter